jgi:hypothetical protein
MDVRQLRTIYGLNCLVIEVHRRRREGSMHCTGERKQLWKEASNASLPKGESRRTISRGEDRWERGEISGEESPSMPRSAKPEKPSLLRLFL